MLKNLLKILLFFFVGIFGGIFGSQILWPYFVERPLFFEYRLEQQPIYITQNITKEIKIQENLALQEAIEEVKRAILAIKSETKKGKIFKGSGIIVFKEGLILTLADLVPEFSKVNVFFDGKKFPAEVLKRDKKENLVLLKIEKEDLQPVKFGDFEKMRLGQRVFLIGVFFEKNIQKKVVNEGILKSFDRNLIETNIFEDPSLIGSSLFDIEGNLIGLNFVEKGKIFSIPISKIKSFLGL